MSGGKCPMGNVRGNVWEGNVRGKCPDTDGSRNGCYFQILAIVPLALVRTEPPALRKGTVDIASVHLATPDRTVHLVNSLKMVFLSESFVRQRSSSSLIIITCPMFDIQWSVGH